MSWNKTKDFKVKRLHYLECFFRSSEKQRTKVTDAIIRNYSKKKVVLNVGSFCFIYVIGFSLCKVTDILYLTPPV